MAKKDIIPPVVPNEGEFKDDMAPEGPYTEEESATIRIINEVIAPKRDRLLDMSRITRSEAPLILLGEIAAILPLMDNTKTLRQTNLLLRYVLDTYYRISRAVDGNLIKDAHAINKVDTDRKSEEAANSWRS